MARAVDVHTHFVPRAFPSAQGRDARWPSIESAGGVNAVVTIGGKLFRQIDSRSWDAEQRLLDMEEDGVAMQVVSPMPELLSYWFSREDADVFADHVNHALAELCTDIPVALLASAWSRFRIRTRRKAARIFEAAGAARRRDRHTCQWRTARRRA